jgi:riboflavin kinase/FMN adenylyltransferase
MKVFHSLTDSSAIRGGFVSIGNFDGVHCGHRSMIALLVRRAREQGVPAVVFTFDPHPICLLRPEFAPPPLSTTARKLELLEECGVDAVLVYPTDRALLDLTPHEFFKRIIQQSLAARGLVEGPNFFFGRGRAGDVVLLGELCKVAGIGLDVVPPLAIGDMLVSSTEVRRLIQVGRVKAAGELLGAPYRLHGTVGEGAKRGRLLGFPTANLTGIATVMPSDGVYAGRVRIDRKSYATAINIGPNPTFAEQSRKVEVHLVDFEGDLYGRPLEVDLIDRLRDTVPFAGVEALQKQLKRDVEQARALAAAPAPG